MSKIILISFVALLIAIIKNSEGMPNYEENFSNEYKNSTEDPKKIHSSKILEGIIKLTAYLQNSIDLIMGALECIKNSKELTANTNESVINSDKMKNLTEIKIFNGNDLIEATTNGNKSSTNFDEFEHDDKIKNCSARGGSVSICSQRKDFLAPEKFRTVK